jgi:hypothetical protein
MNMQYYYINNNSHPQAINAGLIWLTKQCIYHTPHHGILAGVQRSALETALQDTELSQFQIRESLLAGEFKIGTVTLKIMTTKNNFPVNHTGGLLAIHPNPVLLNQIDQMPNLTNILIIPAAPTECQGWITAHQAQEISVKI